MNVCDVFPSFGDLGVPGAKIVSPGRPDLSVLAMRPASGDPLLRMPPLGTAIIDDNAISALTEWIQSPDICAAESDRDLDGVPDDADNCPDTSNPNQSDDDRDGIGDACDSSQVLTQGLAGELVVE